MAAAVVCATTPNEHRVPADASGGTARTSHAMYGSSFTTRVSRSWSPPDSMAAVQHANPCACSAASCVHGTTTPQNTVGPCDVDGDDPRSASSIPRMHGPQPRAYSIRDDDWNGCPAPTPKAVDAIVSPHATVARLIRCGNILVLFPPFSSCLLSFLKRKSLFVFPTLPNLSFLKERTTRDEKGRTKPKKTRTMKERKKRTTKKTRRERHKKFTTF